MKPTHTLLILLIFTSCYKTLELENFNKQEWTSFRTECTNYRLEKVNLLIENQNLLLSSTQNEIESLLGAADEHELYERNQKFFHYKLTPPDSCQQQTSGIKYLSVRFNAIGRASDVQVVTR